MKKALCFILAAALCLSMGVSGLAAAEQTDPAAAYEQIMAAEHMPLEDAWALLGPAETDDGDIAALQQQMEQLMRCQGRFIQTSSDTKNTYTADVAFYLSGGEIYCSVDYSNYGGTLDDGQVLPSDEEGYLFVSHPQGTFYSQTHEFSIHFSEELLHIQWASCDYTLDRGSGSLDDTVSRKETFPESSLYQTFRETLEKMFEDDEFDMVYDEEKDLLTIYVGLDLDKAVLLSRRDDAQESWDGLVENLVALNSAFLTARQVESGEGTPHCSLYMVGKLNANNVYDEDDYLLRLDDEEKNYDFMPSETSVSGSWSPSVSSGSSGSSGYATTGEKNALDKAKRYLELTAFSYSGLIDQLEFEGYSHSEAVYGADHCGADWYEQAALKAQDYLELTSFSRSGLIDQLEFEGFTHDQAVYGVDKVY